MGHTTQYSNFDNFFKSLIVNILTYRIVVIMKRVLIIRSKGQFQLFLIIQININTPFFLRELNLLKVFQMLFLDQCECVLSVETLFYSSYLKCQFTLQILVTCFLNRELHCQCMLQNCLASFYFLSFLTEMNEICFVYKSNACLSCVILFTCWEPLKSQSDLSH